MLLCREWNRTFGGGRGVDRNLRIINQTSQPRELTAAWELLVDGRRVAGAEKAFSLDIGGRVPWNVEFTAPDVSDIAGGLFVLTVREGDREWFRDEKAIRVLPWNGIGRPGNDLPLHVLDAGGELKARLGERGIAFQEVNSLAEVPEGAGVFLVGRDSVGLDSRGDSAWQRLADTGKRIVVFGQTYPLRHRALPGDFEVGSGVGRVSFIQVSSHPVLEGLENPDFFCWSGDHTSYRSAYAKPTRGALSVLQCGAGLSYTPLAECRMANDGLLVLCQMLALEKMHVDPTARMLVDRLINYAFDYAPVRRDVVVALPEDGVAAGLLDSMGLKHARAAELADAIRNGHGKVVLVAATPEHLKLLAAMLDDVREFERAGGWLVLFGVTPEGLAAFNRLVGVQHMMRPYTREAVALALPRNDLAIGMSLSDVIMTTGKRIDWWKGTEYRSHDAYSFVVDYDSVASFATINGLPPIQEATEWPGPRNVVNGISGVEFWRYLAYFEAEKDQTAKLTFDFPAPQTLDRVSVAFDTAYSTVKAFRLTFDDGGEPLEFDVAPGLDPQSFRFEPRTTSRVVFEVTDYEISDKGKDVVGISTIDLHARRPQEFRTRVRPLMAPGALVAYPLGDGGIVLNNINFRGVEANPANATKKGNLLKTMLSNLGAEFAAGKSVVVGQGLEFHPLTLPERMFNIFPRADAGPGKNSWFRPADSSLGRVDISSLPQGEQRFRGVDFKLNDFRMADVPTVVALAGSGSPVQDKELKGVPVGAKADALFFLHAYHPGRQVQRFDDRYESILASGRAQEQLLTLEFPKVLEYVVNYADGRAETVEVRWRKSIGPWISVAEPDDMVGALVAWRAAAAQDAGGFLAVYAMQWNNPRPDVEIESVDLRLPTDVRNIEDHGAPVMFAVTAASAE